MKERLLLCYSDSGTDGCCILGFWIYDMLLKLTCMFLDERPSQQMSHVALSKWETLNVKANNDTEADVAIALSDEWRERVRVSMETQVLAGLC